MLCALRNLPGDAAHLVMINKTGKAHRGQLSAWPRGSGVKMAKGTQTELQLSAGRTAVIGALLITIGQLSMTLYTPALPTIAEVFGTTTAVAKLTLTVYI